MKTAVALISLALCLPAGAASAFEIAFDWKGLKLCNTGRPNVVPSPAFRIKDLPAGTRSVIFKMVDKNVPRYNHGGGTVNVDKGGQLPAGAFRYNSPCPPKGSHVYEWTATAKANPGGRGQTLGTAKAQRSYP